MGLHSVPGIGGFGPYPSVFRSFPMTHEPLVLMPDPASLEDTQTLRSHNYAGAVAAGMFHTNAFVMNNQQFFNWQLAAGLSTWCAEASELLPSWMSAAKWMSSADPRNAALAVTVAASAEVTFPASEQGKRVVVGVYIEETPAGVVQLEMYRCMTVVVVNGARTPIGVKVNLTGVGNLPAASMARRIFNGNYELNLTALPLPSQAVDGPADLGLAYFFDDFVDGGTSNVYRIGCGNVEGAMPTPSRQNFMVDGGFEKSPDVRTPGIFNDVPDAYVSSYACMRTNTSDDRCRVNVCTAAPKSGRYAAKVNLGSGQLVTIALPVNKSAPLQSARNGFNLSMWLRASPSGIVVSPLATSGGVAVGRGSNGAGSDGAKSGGSTTIGSAWTQITAQFSWESAAQEVQLSPLLLQVQSHVASGGTLFIDEIVFDEL